MIKVITVVLLATLSGCAVFDGGKVPETTLAAYQYTGVAKPTLSYSSSAFGGLSATKELPAAGQSVIEGELLSVDRKSTRLNSSHVRISYAVFCLKKKKKK